MEEKLDLEMIAMTLIGRAGESKSLSYQALLAAKEGKFEEAEEYMKKANEEMIKVKRYSCLHSHICRHSRHRF